MSRDAGFWRWYASATDSFRQEVVEKPWYGQSTTERINEHDMPGMASNDAEEAPETLKQPQGEGIHAGASAEELYGPKIDPQPEPEIGALEPE